MRHNVDFTNQKNTFYSNGKLLITGEYFVLDGANALAVPSKLGQSLDVKLSQDRRITWRSLDQNGKLWFSADLNSYDFEIIKSSNQVIAKRLSEVLAQVKRLNKNLFENGYKFETKLQFPRFWGLGTSSTLVNNLANWADVNPYELLSKSFGGSGYDIAAANLNTPFLYKIISKDKREVRIVRFASHLKEYLFFVYLNTKQNSRLGIKHYRSQSLRKDNIIYQIDAITWALIKENKIDNFMKLITEHENIISASLNLEKVKGKYFPDFDGSIKSLGAWGGDFVLGASVLPFGKVKKYFERKGFHTVIGYSELIF